MSKRIIVVGGGPAGIEAALTGARAGAMVTLISETPIGGRAGWASLVPSKVWLHAADTLGVINKATEHGISVDSGSRPDPQAVIARIGQVTKQWNGRLADQLSQAGVTIVSGLASMASPTSVSVQVNGESTELAADAIIVAAGSVPLFPDGMRPDGKRVLAPRFASKLDALPSSIVVVGAGATGTEFAYLFNRLGVKVTWIVNDKGVLPMFAPGAGDLVAEIMAERGVDIVMGQTGSGIDVNERGVSVRLADETVHRADMAFLAVGRRPDISRLDLKVANLTPGSRGELVVDGYGRTSTPTVYAVGDVSGAPMLANQATAQARVAACHAAGLPTHAYRPETVIHAVFSAPQVSQVGLFGGDAMTVRLPFSASLKTHLLDETEGYVELHYDKESHRVRGAVAVGSHAADAIAPAAMAIQMDATVEDLAGPSGAYPTISELAFLAAQQI